MLAPVAVIAVMGSGVAAWMSMIRWIWFLGILLGTLLVFGAPQIVGWIRGLFNV